MPEQDLDLVMRSIGKAIREAQHAIELHGMDVFRSHFEEREGKLAPRTVKVPVPTSDGSYAPRDVPTAALAHHNSLQLEEVRLRMRVVLTHGEEGKPPRVHLAAAKPHGEPAQMPDFAEIELHFRRADAPEGVARVSTEYHKQL